MSPRPPSDAAVALRSLPRRFGALFAGLGDDESPEALAHRPAPDGTTAIGHLTAVVRVITAGRDALDQILVSDQPQLEPVTASGSPDAPPGVTLDERLAELASAAAALADRVDGVPAEDWSREGRGSAGTVTAADRVWDVVDTAVATLRSTEATLTEARRAH